jgi:hypothetical protein
MKKNNSPTSLFGPLSQKNRDTFSSIKEQAFDFMWDGINWKKGVNILLTNKR